MRLSEINSLYKTEFVLMKFMAEKWHTEHFQEGKFRCGNGKFYRDYEKKQGKKGIGDRYEGQMVFVPQRAALHFETSTGNHVIEGKAKQFSFGSNIVSQYPIFSLYALNGDSLEVCHEDDKFYYVKTVFDEKEKILLRKDFGEHVLVIDSEVFLERVIQKMKLQGIKVLKDFIQYEDFSKPEMSKERWNSYQSDEINNLFWKDEKDFMHQKEYRIVLTDQITDYTIYDIGDLHDSTVYITKEELFAEGFRFLVPKNEQTSV